MNYSEKKDAVFQASIDFIKLLTGMDPPPIEIAPPEVFAPFKEFTERVCVIFEADNPCLLQALKANHQWHLDHDEFSGYGESEIFAINTMAIAKAEGKP